MMTMQKKKIFRPCSLTHATFQFEVHEKKISSNFSMHLSAPEEKIKLAFAWKNTISLTKWDFVAH